MYEILSTYIQWNCDKEPYFFDFRFNQTDFDALVKTAKSIYPGLYPIITYEKHLLSDFTPYEMIIIAKELYNRIFRIESGYTSVRDYVQEDLDFYREIGRYLFNLPEEQNV